MAERSFPFPAVDNDRLYSAADWAAYFSQFITNGVFPVGSQLLVTAGTGMQVNVSAGGAWINGYGYVNGSAYTLNIDAADGVLNRIDRIVVRWGRVERAIFLDVRKGTPASSPAAPALVRDADYYDLCIAQISIPAGITAILSGHITDKRLDPSVCGIVSSLITPNTTGWYEGFEAEFLAWFEYIKDILADDPDTGLIAAVAALQGSMTTAQGDIVDLENAAVARMTAGTAPTFTVADPTVTAYYTGLRRTIIAHADSGASPTLNFNGKGAKAVLIATGKAAKWSAGQRVVVEDGGTSFFVCSAGGGVELPVAIAAGDTPLYSWIGYLSPNLATSYTNVGTGCGFTALRTGVFRIKYSFTAINGTPSMCVAKNGSMVANSEIIASAVQAYAMSIDVSVSAGDTINLQYKRTTAMSTLRVTGFSVSILATDLQGEINNVITIV